MYLVTFITSFSGIVFYGVSSMTPIIVSSIMPGKRGATIGAPWSMPRLVFSIYFNGKGTNGTKDHSTNLVIPSFVAFVFFMV